MSIAYYTDWVAFLIVLLHLVKVFYVRTWKSALKCLLLAILFYLILVYIYTVIAYLKGYSVDFNLWHIIPECFYLIFNPSDMRFSRFPDNWP